MDLTMTEFEEEDFSVDGGSNSSVADSDSWEDDQSSHDLDIYDQRFLNILDSKIKAAECFCDQKQYALCAISQEGCSDLNMNLEAQSTLAHSQTSTSVSTRDVGCQCVDNSNRSDKAEASGGKPQFSLVDLQSDISSVQTEIQNLKSIRESLVSHTKDALDDIKNESAEDSRQMLEWDEAIDIVDTLIGFKNQRFCGNSIPPPKLFSLKQDEDLIGERLTCLPSAELRGLFHRFFHKVVELRENVKQLERVNDQLEILNDDANRRVKRYQNKLRQQEEAFAANVRMFTSPNTQASVKLDNIQYNANIHNKFPEQPSASTQNYAKCASTIHSDQRYTSRHHTNTPEIRRDGRKITLFVPAQYNN